MADQALDPATAARLAEVCERHAQLCTPGQASADAGTGGNSDAGREPEHSDTVITERTGRGWQEWCRLIDAWPGNIDGHAAVAGWLVEEHGVEGWWAQSVTVGWERLTGRRLPHQVADGTFTAGRSTTITTDGDALGVWLRDDAARERLLPGFATELRSRPTSRNVRLAMPTGTAELAIATKPDGRVTVTVQHAKLPAPEQVPAWKAFWGAWLAALDRPEPR